MQALVVGDSRATRLEEVWRSLPGWDVSFMNSSGMQWARIEETLDDYANRGKRKPSAIIIVGLFVDAIKRKNTPRGKRIYMHPAIADAREWEFPNLTGLRPLLKRVNIKLRRYWRGVAIFWVAPYTIDVRKYHEDQLRMVTKDKQAKLTVEEEEESRLATYDFYQYYEMLAKMMAEEIGSYNALPWNWFCNHTLKEGEDPLEVFMEKLKDGVERRHWVYPNGHDDGIHPTAGATDRLRRSLREKLYKLYSPNERVHLSFLSKTASPDNVHNIVPSNKMPTHINGGTRPKEYNRKPHVDNSEMPIALASRPTTAKSETYELDVEENSRAIAIPPIENSVICPAEPPTTKTIEPVEPIAENIQIVSTSENEVDELNLSASLGSLSMVANRDTSSTFSNAMSETSRPALAKRLQLDVVNSSEIVRFPCGHSTNSGTWYNLQCPICGGSWSNPQGNTKVVVKMTRMVMYEVTAIQDNQAQ